MLSNPGFADVGQIRLHCAECGAGDIYGERDHAVLPKTVHSISRFIDAPFSELQIANSAHWVQNEVVEEVNAALLEFLDKGSLAAN